jgi:hypothetical protein
MSELLPRVIFRNFSRCWDDTELIGRVMDMRKLIFACPGSFSEVSYIVGAGLASMANVMEYRKIVDSARLRGETF